MYINFNKPLDEIQEVLDAVKEGYGGTYHDGQVADRRKDNNRSLRPIPANLRMGIPEPKEISRENVSNTPPKT